MLRRVLVLLLALLIAPPGVAQDIRPEAIAQIEALIREKQARTPTEQKLDSNLLSAARMVARRAAGDTRPAPAFVDAFIAEEVAPDRTVHVTIRAIVSDDLTAYIRSLGASEVAVFARFDTVTARLPLDALLTLAARPDVSFIAPLEKATTNRDDRGPTGLDDPASPKLSITPKVGAATSQGVVAHGADKSHATGVTGVGSKVCVLSDGINTLATQQATGDLPASVSVLPGQAGNGDEGTAMLEIVYDMAPGAPLGYATGFGGIAQMATNILNLGAAGCDVIVDDVSYFLEPAFQDGPIAQAVASVQAAGALYFSSAANSGNLTKSTSGTWEGDWVASGVLFDGFPTQLFGAFPYDVLTKRGSVITLKWSDPQGGSANDYDLYVLDPSGSTIVNASFNSQTGTQDPVEGVGCDATTCPTNALVIVVQYSGAARALRLDTHRGTLSVATAGSTYGHNATPSLSVAAVNVATAAGGSFVGGVANPVETFSSDGPRKLFYQPNGAAITPGNVLFATNGGTTLPKVDLAAADGVVTTQLPGGLNPFFGTSAAAPHAAALAALVWSAKPSATAAAVQSALLGSALDIEAAGFDRDSGVGIVMAPAAVRAVLTPLTVGKQFAPSTVAAGGTSTLTITLTNPNAVALQGVAFTDTYPAGIANAASPNTGVSGAGCSGTRAATPGGGSFAVTAGVVPAGGTCSFFVTVTGSSPGSFTDSSGAVTTPIALNSPAASATLTVGAPPSSNANLANLVFSGGPLTPPFASGTLSYSASVTSASNTVTVTPTVADPTATVKVNGVTVASGSPSGPITLNVGPNVITVLVTAQDGVTTKTYTINATYATVSCVYSLSPLDLPNFAAGGGPANVVVTVPSGCPVTATSFQPWVVVTGITPSGGTTTVSLQIGANSGTARATAIRVADRLFLITQQGP